MADKNVERRTEDRDILGWPRPDEFRPYQDWVKGNSPDGSFAKKLEDSLAGGMKPTGGRK